MDDLKEYVIDQFDGINEEEFDVDALKQIFEYITAFAEDNYLI